MDRSKLANAVGQIAWGYLLLHLNLNIGPVNILPNWLGYRKMVAALPDLGEEEPSVLLLRPLGILLALGEGVLWVLAIFGVTFDHPIFTIVMSAVSLYFHFQLLTNLAHLAEVCGCPERERLLRLRTVRTLLITLLALPVAWQRYAVVVGAVVVNLVVVLWLCAVLFSLRRSLETELPDAPAEQTE